MSTEAQFTQIIVDKSDYLHEAGAAIEAKAVELDSETVAEALLPSKRFVWGFVFRGDCKLWEGSNLTLFSDGTIALDFTVSSGDTNDTWEATFHFLDGGGAIIGGCSLGVFRLPIQNSNQNYRYILGPNWPSGCRAANFNNIARVSMACDC